MLAVDTLGRYLMYSSIVVTLSWESVSPDRAWMASGTSCRFSVRRCAVTKTSSRAFVVCWARTAGVGPTARTAATADTSL